ncbi:glucose dehydrogenase [FAD, quinone]-like [Thrips palmi]|uniref:Glucose dehydrogenase [FAD, quinone]-like n=1 Tax=Thrips palmi TaxID=161013 RepID=A0A6P9A0D0_THRPL|nr:glucose dehydrogenase [FAD, quinone]-like [Thrips palmi]
MAGSMWLAPLTSAAAWQSSTHCTAASLFATLVLSLANKTLKTAQEKARKTPNIAKGEYDFIVVGAGSAGCVVANRLSEEKGWKVLLLEAGAEETDINMVPSMYNRYMEDDFFYWRYNLQKSGWNPGSVASRGKGMGGSSAVNALHFTRGNREDFDNIKAMGNPGWGYEDVLKYFKKSENNHNFPKDTKYHGTGGPQDVTLDTYREPNTELLLKAYQEIGMARVEDVNGASQLGTSTVGAVSWAPSAMLNGERRSSNRAYLGPAVRKRPNLTVQTRAFVRRVVVSGGRAVGVEFDGPAGRKTVTAKKEVILSCGAYNSPQVLMLSGIGPKKHLQEVGIKTVLDLPGVGQRLHDHIFAKGNVKFMLSKTASTGTVQQYIKTITEYVQKRTGPLSGSANPANLFYRSAYQAKGSKRPDIQIPVGGSQYIRKLGAGCQAADAAGVFYNQLGFNAINLHPKSRGQILLNKTDLYGSPLVYTNVFGDESDLKPIIEAYKMVVRLNSTGTFRNNGITLSIGSPKACAKLRFNSDAYWKCTFQGQGAANQHPTSSCSMGPDSDKLAVVDAKLKVRGIKGLRVIDASVLPETTSGNTNAVCVMVGEKGADLVKADWKK